MVVTLEEESLGVRMKAGLRVWAIELWLCLGSGG
jgi:hypothetical protein